MTPRHEAGPLLSSRSKLDSRRVPDTASKTQFNTASAARNNLVCVLHVLHHEQETSKPGQMSARILSSGALPSLLPLGDEGLGSQARRQMRRMRKKEATKKSPKCAPCPSLARANILLISRMLFRFFAWTEGSLTFGCCRCHRLQPSISAP